MQLSDKDSCTSSIKVKYTDLLKSETCRVVYLLSRNFNDKRAGGEALADVVERLARVASRVLGEDLLDDQAVRLTRRLVLEVLARLDLLLVVQPEHVVLLSTTFKSIVKLLKFPESGLVFLNLVRITAVCNAIMVFTNGSDHHSILH